MYFVPMMWTSVRPGGGCSFIGVELFVSLTVSEAGVVGRFTGAQELTLISLDRIGLARHRLNIAEPEPVADCALPPTALE